jgi:RNA 3'-terminal phosphate cyclase
MSGTGEHFQPADWFRDCSMYGVHSKPNRQRLQTRRSGHHPEGGPRISITEHFGYMGIVSPKGDWL